jgi:HlyD family secretion protein
LTQLDLSDARKQLSDIQESAISPISGTVTTVNVSKGKSVDTSTVLVTIADFNDLIVKADISEYDVPKLAVGQTCFMTSDGLDGVSYTGVVLKIADSAVSGGSGTVVPVEFSINEIDGMLKPGFNLDIDITVAQSGNVVAVPIVSILKDQTTGGNYVFKVDESRMVRRADVTLGLTGDMVVEVKSGVSEGDEIISSPTSSMFDGMPLAGYIGESREGQGLFDMFDQRGMGGGATIQTRPAGAASGGTGGSRSMPSGNAAFSRP